ncbi:15255_t:CDS:2 [Cetraspora pellucida]|uniref:15255_t:CDS:1 n=1 Tax=Cetraspora pellucida TaxID=1433469 RepID=A0A9N9DSR5_9GLOM|nr:15255_t:CDS:2 [Cetraspora pellucida]
MSSIKHNEFELDLVESNTEIKAQSLTSITSSSNNSNNPAFFRKQMTLRSKLFYEKLFEKKDLSPEHLNAQTHHKVYYPNNDPRKNDEPLKFTQSAFRELITKWIVLDSLLFITTESKHFQQIIKLLNPNAHVPIGDTVKNDIMSNFENKHMNMKCLLQNVLEKLLFTIDTWMLVNIDSFFSITVHWISENWELKNTLLDFINLCSPYSGENLCNTFVESCCKFGFLTKVFAITSDNVTSNDTFMKHLEHVQAAALEMCEALDATASLDNDLKLLQLNNNKWIKIKEENDINDNNSLLDYIYGNRKRHKVEQQNEVELYLSTSQANRKQEVLK